MGQGLVNRFIDNLKVVTTNNSNTIADVHILKITAANTKSFPACSAFTRRFLVTASNNGYFSAVFSLNVS
jgi:hypothetical protein